MDAGDLKAFLEKRITGRSLAASATEQATRQGLVEPILRRLGWDIEDLEEVTPEYTVQGRKVDYCLRTKDHALVYVEVKRTGTDLDGHEEQLLAYAFKGGVRLAVLTDGVVWRLYLPLQDGSWQDRRFLSIDIHEQGAAKAAEHFREFLGKDRVVCGEAERAAKMVQQSRTRERKVEKTLPEAWRRILEEPDVRLIELLAERVESICGYMPTPEQVRSFLDRSRREPPGSPPLEQPGVSTVRRRPGHVRPDSASVTGRKPRRMTCLGEMHSVQTWRDVLIRTCEVVARRHPEQFRQVLGWRGRSRPYFSRNPGDLREPRSIPGTDIYAEVNLSAEVCRARAEDVLAHCGYDATSLTVAFE